MLLSSEEFRDRLEASLESSNERVIVLSAFVKLHALKWLLEHTQANEIIIVARWQPNDLICGASDLQCYEFCRDNGIPFGISLNLHGKVYCIDQYILVGSANLTSRGMALSNKKNSEVGIGFVGGAADQIKINKMLSQVTWLDDEILISMRAALENSCNKTQENSEWPDSILATIAEPITHLWSHELPFCNPCDLLKLDSSDENYNHDFALLDINSNEADFTQLLIAFEKTKAFRWFTELVDTEKSVSFGKVAAELHKCILDDPTPYRMEIKGFVKNLLDWAAFYPKQFLISRPRYSIVVKSVKSKKNS